MGDHVRTRQYPLLPTARRGAERTRLALPEQGDLRLRSLVPTAFLQQLSIHCQPEARHVYDKFLVKRRFIVMALGGDLFMKDVDVPLLASALPPMLALPPPLAPWDIVKVLDLVQCFQYAADGTLVPNVRWELVRVRWRSGRETWVPIELMASQPPVLLQEFYVNTINSWHFVDRVFPDSLARFRTEVELWFHHPEFQPLYQKWRNRAARLLAGNTAAQANGAAQTTTQADVKDRQLTAEAQRAFPQQTPPAQPTQRIQQPQAAQLTQLAPRIQQPQVAQPTQATQRIPQAQPTQPSQTIQPPPQPVHSNGSRIPPQPLATVTQLPPLPPTPPRPSQERPPELRRGPPPLSLNGHREPPRQSTTNGASASSTPAHNKPKSKEKDARRDSTPSKSKEKEKKSKEKSNTEKEREKAKEKHRDKENERQDKSKERDKEKHKEKRDKHKDKSKQKEKEREKEKEKEKEKERKKKRKESSKRDHESSPKKSPSKRRRDRSPETPRTADRRRKRLKWSQATSDDDESDDLLELSQSGRDRSDGQKEKRFRRLRKAADRQSAERDVIVIDDEDNDDVIKLSLKKKKKKEKDEKGRKDKKRSDDKDEADGNEQDQSIEIESVPHITDIDGDDEETADDESSTQEMLLGEIRCECGATKVNRYTGQWVQCCKEDCEVWQHAECVGLLIRRGEYERLPDKYCCSKCDPEAFKKRYQKAKLNLRAWLSLCCGSKNQHQLLKLLDEEEQRDAEVASELAASAYGTGRLTLLMEAARNGLTHTVRRLMRRYKVNVHATDAWSRNALYHAVRGESVSVADFLMKNAEALVRHQDLNGVMPLHLMLRSPTLNGLCLPLLKKDHTLCVTSDFGGIMPIHFACQAVNHNTVENVRQILSVQPMAALEKSSERLTPFLYLCRASKGVTSAEIAMKASCVKQIVDLFLDVDVLAEFFCDRDLRGWTGLHFAAEVGNHSLLTYLSGLEEVDIDAMTFDGGETALHLAASGNHPEAIRVLLENRRQRLEVVAVDSLKQIPAMRTTDISCLQLLLHYDLERQLRVISNHARNYRYHELLRNWMRFVTSDPVSYAIVNDWLQYQIPLLDELDELFLLHRAFFRVDCKLDYVYEQVFPSIKRQSRPPRGSQNSIVEITLSAQGECYWKQFVSQTRDFGAVVFRQKLRVAIARGENLRLDNLTLVLVRLLAGLLQPSTGLLVRNGIDATLDPSPHRHADDVETIREYFILGELVAYLVLNEVSVGEIFEFSTSFLTAVLGARFANHDDSTLSLRIFAESFAAGFEAVLPATLALFHVEELRVLLNARVHSLNVSAMDWKASVDWVGFTESGKEVFIQWWMRMVDELVEEERVALVLWLTSSFRHAQLVFFDADPDQSRVRIQRFKAPTPAHNGIVEGEDSELFSVDEDKLLPVLDATSRTLVLPTYSSFERFRTAVLGVFRHADHTLSLR